MLLCYMPVKNENQTTVKLCLMADRPEVYTLPVEIDKIQVTQAAVLSVSSDEACTVSIDEEDNGIIISAMDPTRIYLTPNLSQFPGFNTKHVKLYRYDDGSYSTLYSRDKITWEEWVPNRERQ